MIRVDNRDVSPSRCRRDGRNNFSRFFVDSELFLRSKFFSERRCPRTTLANDERQLQSRLGICSWRGYNLKRVLCSVRERWTTRSRDPPSHHAPRQTAHATDPSRLQLFLVFECGRPPDRPAELCRSPTRRRRRRSGALAQTVAPRSIARADNPPAFGISGRVCAVDALGEACVPRGPRRPSETCRRRRTPRGESARSHRSRRRR